MNPKMNQDMQPELQLIHSHGVLTEVVLAGEVRSLTQRERSILSLLAREPGKVVLRDELLDGDMAEHDLYNQIYRLRRKLGRQYIEQVGGRSGRGPGAGSGYRLVGLRVVWVERRVG